MKPQLQNITIDTVLREETVKDLVLEEAITIYERERENIKKMNNWWERQEYAFNLEIPILNTTQLQLFCAHDEPHDAFPHYLNSLIQKSYKEGNNNFTLAFNILHDRLLQIVQGTKEQPLTITINGHTKDYCAAWSKYLKLTINGNTGNKCALASEDTTVTINGNTKDWCADLSKHAKITINGTKGKNPSPDATYYTNNQETYEKLTTYGCKVTLR